MYALGRQLAEGTEQHPISVCMRTVDVFHSLTAQVIFSYPDNDQVY